MMKFTVNVDLLWADLDDFKEHFEREIASWIYKALSVHYGSFRPRVLWGDAEWPITPQVEHLRSHLEPQEYVRVHIDDVGRTGRVYWIFRVVGGEEFFGAWVYVSRYRRDRLRLVAGEESDGKLNISDGLREWLTKLWGSDGIVELESEDAPKPPQVELTPVETEIAGLLAKGMSDKEIGEERIASPATVATHRKRLAAKLNIPADKKTIGETLKRLGY